MRINYFYTSNARVLRLNTYKWTKKIYVLVCECCLYICFVVCCACRSQVGVVPGGDVGVVERRLREREVGGGGARVLALDVHVHAEPAADLQALHRIYRYLVVPCNSHALLRLSAGVPAPEKRSLCFTWFVSTW